jgi:hypothetical protein
MTKTRLQQCRAGSFLLSLAIFLSANARVVVDLTRIGHVSSKGRLQDQESNEVINALIAAGPDSVPFLLSKLVDATEVPGQVFDFWPRVRVADVALVALLDLFTPPDKVNATVPGMSWDSLLERREGENISGWELLERYVAAHGRKGVQRQVEQLLSPYKGRLVWDASGRCFRPAGSAPPNNRINATVGPVTPLACASGAPVRPARYVVR